MHIAHTWKINGERDSRSGQLKNIYTHFVHSLFLGHSGSTFGKLFVNNNNEPNNNRNQIEISHLHMPWITHSSTSDSSVWSINATPYEMKKKKQKKILRWTIHLLYLFIKIYDESFFFVYSFLFSFFSYRFMCFQFACMDFLHLCSTQNHFAHSVHNVRARSWWCVCCVLCAVCVNAGRIRCVQCVHIIHVRVARGFG